MVAAHLRRFLTHFCTLWFADADLPARSEITELFTRSALLVLPRRTTSTGASSRAQRSREAAQFCQQFALGPIEERRLSVAPDLHQRDMSEAGVDETFDGVDMGIDVGSTRHLLRDVVLTRELRSGREVFGAGQLGHDFPTRYRPAKLLAGSLDRR